MTPEIRPIREDELPAFIDALSTGFLDRPDVARIAREIGEIWDLSRTRAAFDDGRICGTFRSWPTELTVPGASQLPATAVSAVTVLPTHRRRGILRAMIASEHDLARERGDALALLYASEYPIYGRFGYGVGCREATWTIDARAAGMPTPADANVALAPLDETTRDAVVGVFEQWRLRQVGELRRRAVSWEFDLGLREEFWGKPWKGWVALHRDGNGDVDGYLRYHADEKWSERQPKNTLVVDELHGLDEAAVDALWRFALGMDWIAVVRAERRSPADPLPWRFRNARAASVGEVGDSLWVRLIDARRALEGRRYEREGRIVLEIVDAEAAGGRLRLVLDAGPDGATCTPTNLTADLTVDVAALGAAYLGGTPLRHAALASGVDEHRNGALAEADALLRTLDEPWCSTFF